MRFSLMAKLTVAFSAVLVLSAGAGAFTLVELATVNRTYQQASEASAANTDAADILANVNGQVASVRGYLVTLDRQQMEHFRVYDKAVDREIASIKSHVTDAEEIAATEQIQKGSDDYTALANQVFTLVDQGMVKEAMDLVAQKGLPIANGITEVATNLSNKAEQRAADLLEQADATAARARMYGMIALAAAVVAGLGLAVAVARSLSRPVRLVADLAATVAGGDLTVKELQVTSRDEVGDMARSFNQMVHSLRGLLDDVQKSTGTVLEASEGLQAAAEQASQGAQGAAQAVGQVAGGAAEQANASDEMRRTMDELKQTIGQIASGSQSTAGEVQRAASLLAEMVNVVEDVACRARGVATATGEAAQTAQGGARVVEATVTGMERIQRAVGESAERIRELEQLSGQIGAITQVISDLSDQTNLLALNAAIEAARAGEHGRGFAVVAEEVRTLAERSSKSARDISALIGNIQQRTADAVRAMESGNSEVQDGARLAGEAGRALDQILQMVTRAAGDVSNIAEAAQGVRTSVDQVVEAFDSVAAVTEENTAATEEMAAGVEQVVSTVAQVASVSQSNAAAAQEVSAATEEMNASAEEVAASAETLARIANRLQEQVARFKV